MLERVPPRAREIPQIRRILQNSRYRNTRRIDEPFRRVTDSRPGIADCQRTAPAATQRDAYSAPAREPQRQYQTSEAKLSENMITTQNQESERIATKSAVVPGLDKQGAKRAEAVRREQEDSNGSSAAPGRPAGRRERPLESVADSRRAEASHRENQTNEAKPNENVIITKNQEPVRVVANSVGSPGLDKRGPTPDEAGGGRVASAEISRSRWADRRRSETSSSILQGRPAAPRDTVAGEPHVDQDQAF